MGIKLWIALLIVLVQGMFCQGEIFEIVLSKNKIGLICKKTANT